MVMIIMEKQHCMLFLFTYLSVILGTLNSVVVMDKKADDSLALFASSLPGGISQLNPSTNDGCHVFLTESIPDNLTYSTGAPEHISTYFAWSFLLDHALKEVNLVSFYWTLQARDVPNAISFEQGENIFSLLKDRAKQLNMSVVQSGLKEAANHEQLELQAAGANFHWLNVPTFLGQGIVHSKLWTVDGLHGYLGSANMDLRSLTQVKELGVTMFNCPELIEDLNKVVNALKFTADNGVQSSPHTWPTNLTTIYNRENPMKLKINGAMASVFFTSSPTEFTPPGRSDDLETILSIINTAKKYIYISVMDYSPEIVNYGKSENIFWPVIDNALRRAAVDRGVEVRLLISKWKHTPPAMYHFLKSLRALDAVKSSVHLRVRLFVVPAFTEAQKNVPFGRVNHNKYMVTDNTVYIGTSNWSGDYFLFTTGSAFVAQDITGGNEPNKPRKQTLREQTTAIFYRDWNSEYADEM